jgi:lipopolysaccharide/colanic/teichoic acid biosynthesis glycosyltransferase
MNLDMAYIDRWSLWLDLKLIARTFATVLRGNGC